MDILLTNDDGIESNGLRVLYEALSSIGDVLVVAPRNDQSAIGRALSTEVRVEQRDIGYAVSGTPSDCVIAGLEAIGPYPDLVVSGCNKGANLGAYVLGRSGTVSAAVEAAFFGVPSIAVSLYIPEGEYPFHPDRDAYDNAIQATRYLVEHSLAMDVFDFADYLNVNAPIPGDRIAPIEITHPSHGHAMDAVQNEDGTITLHDRIWKQMRDQTLDEPQGTDRRAVLDGRVSVSPLTAPHTIEHHDSLDALVDEYNTTVA